MMAGLQPICPIFIRVLPLLINTAMPQSLCTVISSFPFIAVGSAHFHVSLLRSCQVVSPSEFANYGFSSNQEPRISRANGAQHVPFLVVSRAFISRYFHLHCKYHNNRHFLENALRSQESCLPPHQSGARWHPRWPFGDIVRCNGHCEEAVFHLWNWSRTVRYIYLFRLHCFYLLSGCDRCWKSICDHQTNEAPNRSHCVLLAWPLAHLDHCCIDQHFHWPKRFLTAPLFDNAPVRSSIYIAGSSPGHLSLLLLHIVGHITTIASAWTEEPAEQKARQDFIHCDVFFTGQRNSRRHSNLAAEEKVGSDPHYRRFLRDVIHRVCKLFDKPVRVRPENARVPTGIQATLRGPDRELAAEPRRSDTNGGRGGSCGDSEVSGDPRDVSHCSAYRHMHWPRRK